MFLNWLIKQFGDYTLFLLITNAFLVGTWAYMAKIFLPNNFLIGFAMILVSNMFFPVRLQLAAGIFCWVIFMIYKKQWTKAVLCYLITCFFHKSAIILFPIIPLLLVRVSNFIAFSILLLSLVGEVVSSVFSDYMVIGALFLSKYYPDLAVNIATYSNMAIVGRTENSLLSFIMSFTFSFILLLSILYGRGLIERKNKNRNKKVFLNEVRLYNIFLNCFLLFTFIYKFFSAEALSNLTRLSEFFTCGYAISIIMAYEIIKKGRNAFIAYSLFAFFYMYKLSGLLSTPYQNLFFPYYSIFDNSFRRVL